MGNYVKKLNITGVCRQLVELDPEYTVQIVIMNKMLQVEQGVVKKKNVEKTRGLRNKIL